MASVVNAAVPPASCALCRTVTGTLRGSRHPLVGRALDGLAAALERLREADHLAAQNAEAVRAYAHAIGIDIPAPSNQPARNAGQTGTSAQPATGVVPPTQGWVDDTGSRLPRRPSGKGPTHGLFFDAGGTPLTGASPHRLTRPGAHHRAFHIDSPVRQAAVRASLHQRSATDGWMDGWERPGWATVSEIHAATVGKRSDARSHRRDHRRSRRLPRTPG